MKMAKINKKIGGGTGVNKMKKAGKRGGTGLEDGKRFRARFWDAFRGIFPAKNPQKDNHNSHINQQGNNKENNHQNKMGDNCKNQGGGARSREGVFGIKQLLIIIFFILIFITSFILLVSALTDNERQSLNDELSNLSAQLSSQGYSWLVDYNSKNGGGY